MDELIEILNQWATRRVMVLTDTNVAGLYPQYFERLSSVFECQTMVVPAGEESKNTEQLIRIWNRMLDFEMTRSSCSGVAQYVTWAVLPLPPSSAASIR